MGAATAGIHTDRARIVGRLRLNDFLISGPPFLLLFSTCRRHIASESMALGPWRTGKVVAVPFLCSRCHTTRWHRGRILFAIARKSRTTSLPVDRRSSEMLRNLSAVLLHLVMLALVCAIGAYWAMRIMTPAPANSPPAQTASVSREADPVLAARVLRAGAGGADAGVVECPGDRRNRGRTTDSAAVLVVDGRSPRASTC